jgi:hypothetical protein
MDDDFIKKTGKLSVKVGDGGLDQSILDKADAVASSIIVDYKENIKNQIVALKSHVADEKLVSQQNSAVLEIFIFDLLPLKVDSHQYSNEPLNMLAARLLTFVESLTQINMDSYHIIRAHVNAIDLVFQRHINDASHKFAVAVLKELDDALARYNNKHKKDFSAEAIKEIAKF